MRFAVLGAGTMGAGIAFSSILKGHEVLLFDSQVSALARARSAIEHDVDGAIKRSLIPASERGMCLDRAVYTERLDDALRGTDVIIEAIVEDLGVKQHLLKDVEALAPNHAIIASNTSAISITSLMSALSDRSRGIGMHFFNPVRSMILCEVVVGLETSAETTETAKHAALALGKTPIVVRDSPGFVTSRINVIIGNEAFFLLEEGVASAEDIDAALKLGLNHPMGPLELSDLVGLDVRLAVLRELHRVFGDKYRPSPLLERYVNAGRLGRKTGIGVYDYRTESGK